VINFIPILYDEEIEKQKKIDEEKRKLEELKKK
jgi:hypothetical protein